MREQPILAGLDPEVLERLASRREALRTGGKLTTRLGLASVPLAIAATARAAFANQLPAQVVTVLNFALTLEYLEAEFYILGVASGIIPASSTLDSGDTYMDLATFTTIRDHEIAHVNFLKGVLGQDAVPKPTFDFTAGGAFSPFSDYRQFKLLAQAFEDTGVRAYKGQTPALLPFDQFLTAAATIHSVEARHASEVRRLRGFKGWIPFDQSNVPAAVAPVYAGEEFLNIAPGAVASFGITAEDVTESFDEPLTMAQVLAIADPFIVG